MAFNFTIVFSGICMFVADPPFDSPSPVPRQMKVLLRDLTNGLPLGNNESVPPHFPVLIFDVRNRRANSSKTTDARTIGLCILQQNDVEVLTTGPSQTAADAFAANMTLVNSEPKDLLNPGEDSNSLFFLVSLSKALKQSVRISPGLLLPQPDPAGLLAARVTVKTGKLSTGKLQDGSWAFVPVGSKGASPDSGQRLAETVALTISELSQDVILRFTPLGGGSPEDLVLGPFDGQTGDVSVTISNSELPRIAELLSIPSMPLADQDFRAYYDMLSPLPAAPVMPQTASNSDLVEHAGGCTPARP